VLSPENPAFAAYPGAPAIFVWDDDLLAEGQISFKRVLFFYECLLDLPVEIRRGDVAEEVLGFAGDRGARRVVTVESVSPRFAQIRRKIEHFLPVEVLPLPPFVAYEGDFDLKRFSRYWRKAEKYVP
jgi:hypothetical protein